MVVGFEHVAGVVGGGDHYGGDSAELEVDDGTEFVSELSKGVMWRVCEEMKVTEYRETWR